MKMKSNFFESKPIEVIANFLHVKDLYNFSKTCRSLYQSYKLIVDTITDLNQKKINFQTYPNLKSLNQMEKLCFLNLVAKGIFNLDYLSYYSPIGLKDVCSTNLTSLLLDKYISPKMLGDCDEESLKILTSDEAVTAFHENKITETDLYKIPLGDWEKEIKDSLSQAPSK